MDHLREAITAYCPGCEQEESDRRIMLELLETQRNLLTRDNRTAHFTASAWLVNESRTKVVLVYHNIYRSWSWTGGHADGEADLLQVARREAMEETGLRHIRTVSEDIFSLEILTVDGHIKRGSYVPSHLHLNLTYLLEAEETEALAVKPDENSGVRWFSPEEALRVCTEPWMVQWIYSKLNDRAICKRHMGS